MIIVNQDKNRIVNFDNILDIHTQKSGEKSLIFVETERYAIFLGEYETEERAKAIIREIKISYQRNAVIKITSDKDIQDQIFNLLQENGIDFDTYEMPEN